MTGFACVTHVEGTESNFCKLLFSLLWLLWFCVFTCRKSHATAGIHVRHTLGSIFEHNNKAKLVDVYSTLLQKIKHEMGFKKNRLQIVKRPSDKSRRRRQGARRLGSGREGMTSIAELLTQKPPAFSEAATCPPLSARDPFKSFKRYR